MFSIRDFTSRSASTRYLSMVLAFLMAGTGTIPATLAPHVVYANDLRRHRRLRLKHQSSGLLIRTFTNSRISVLAGSRYGHRLSIPRSIRMRQMMRRAHARFQTAITST